MCVCVRSSFGKETAWSVHALRAWLSHGCFGSTLQLDNHHHQLSCLCITVAVTHFSHENNNNISFSHKKFRLLSLWIVSSRCCTTQSCYFPTTAISPDTNPFLVHARVSLHYKLWRGKQQRCLYGVSLDCEVTPLFVNNGVSLYCGTNTLFIHAGGFTANPQSTKGFTAL